MVETDVPPAKTNQHRPHEDQTSFEILRLCIEVITLLVLGIYTAINYELYEATLRGLAATEGAYFSASFSQNSGNPGRGGVGVNFYNNGKTSAKAVTGSLSVIWKNADGAILERQTVKCGGPDNTIQPTEYVYGCWAWLDAARTPLDDKGHAIFDSFNKQTAEIHASLRWDDGFGNILRLSRCHFLFAPPNIFADRASPDYGKFNTVQFPQCMERGDLMRRYDSVPAAIEQLKRYDKSQK